MIAPVGLNIVFVLKNESFSATENITNYIKYEFHF